MSLYELATASDRPAKAMLKKKAAEADDSGAGGASSAVNFQSTEVKSALTKIARFIPTETVTIYLGAISAATALQTTFSWLSPALIYWASGIFLTPLIFFLIVATERARAKQKFFINFPYWKLIAAILGFLIWALAVPGNPYIVSDIAKVATAFLALVTSVILDLIDQLYDARQQAGQVT
jgi:hypothetical protein